MKYPDEFIAKCKIMYPSWNNLHRHLDAGSTIAGRLIDDDCHSSAVENNDILTATSLQGLQDKALQYKRKVDLFEEWVSIIRNQAGVKNER